MSEIQRNELIEEVTGDEMTLKLAELRSLLWPTSTESREVTADAISGNGFAARINWGPRLGLVVLTINGNFITNKTIVYVAAGEGTGGGGKFMGDARYTVHNIAPDTGKVAVRFEISWPTPINLTADYLFIEP
jgi:hypothetical protein